MERSPEIVGEVRRLYEALSAGDVTAVDRALSDAGGIVFIGTDPGEWLEDVASVRDMLRAQVDSGVELRPGPVAAFQEGTVGWAVDRGTLVLPDGTEAPFRMTLVLHREDGAWKIVQQHTSVGVPEEALGVDL